jgi:hypothetical protein
MNLKNKGLKFVGILRQKIDWKFEEMNAIITELIKSSFTQDNSQIIVIQK